MTKTNSNSDRTLRVHLVGGNPEGLRHVDSLASMVTVTAAPLALLNSFTKNVDNQIGFMAYVCEGPLSYIGHGYAERRLGERFSKADRCRIDQAYVVHSADPRFGKDIAEKLEDRLIEIARGHRVPLANDPMVGGLGKAVRSPAIEELLHDVRQKLWTAGCRLFEHRHPAGKPNAVSCNGIEVVKSEDFEKMEKTQPMRLTCHGMKASAYTVGSKFIVVPGSEFNRVARKGLTKHNLKRRAFVEDAGVLEDIPGVTDRARLRVALAFDSAAVAAKILVGKHVGSKVWVPAAAPRLVAGAGHE
jgi:hypothetical protein